MEKPEVSVVMAVYNERPFLKEAVQSILAQTFEDFEFIIINDGSTDGSQETLGRFAECDERIRLVHQENRGLVSALNRGLSMAGGQYIARMDGDDVTHPERFERQVNYLNTHSRVGILGTRAQKIDENGEPTIRWTLPTNPDTIAWQLLFNTRLCHPAVMARKSILEDLSGYSAWATHAEDYELWTRAVLRTRLANLPDVLHRLRRHEGSITVEKRVEQVQTTVKAAVTLHRSLLGVRTNEQLSRFLIWMHIIGIERAIEETGLEDFPAAFEYMCSLYEVFVHQVASGGSSVEARQSALPKLDSMSKKIGKKEGWVREVEYKLRARTMSPFHEAIPWVCKAIERRFEK
jgi:glycosyltransferase involved in cell wall biosynthesis